ncbi:GH25 family lysozyme [Candidatus Enterococcus ferrettii]|uniref:DUF5648 domain-containing protein n=1 Tax=Candidatus Enterococcus ferrettii TaxID=2815324 RepID=A0ABV0EQG5_9ENTE|nr:GH25 family lysozyme [Enterococcus sp. 665A]MBO1339214.1 hypothetical protein [Enterococcus sp. 665A]
MKKKILGMSLLAVFCLNITSNAFAEDVSKTNSSGNTNTSTAENSVEVQTSETTEVIQSSDSSSEIANSMEEVKPSEESESQEEPNQDEEDINPSEITTEEGTFYLPSGRSDAPSLFRAARAAASIPVVQATNNNTPTKSFIDVSSHNGTISVEAYQSMKKYGVTGVVVKLTQGTWYKNPLAASQINNARAAGLKVSAYHYSEFTTDAQAIAEANYFATSANSLGLAKGTVMVNDIEDPSIAGKGDHTSNSRAFGSRLNQHGFANVRHYVGLHWIKDGRINTGVLGNKNIWVAAYPYNLSQNNLYTEYGAWQWNSQLRFPNVGGNFDISADYTGAFINPQASDTVAMHRLYNPNNSEHFYTQNGIEKDLLVSKGWRYEGIGWNAPTSGAPVYRLYNPNAGDHHYTLNFHEKENLVRLGWRYEGISWYSGGNITLLRLYNPNAKAGSHHYTMNVNEKNNLVRLGWRYEGLAWYGK